MFVVSLFFCFAGLARNYGQSQPVTEQPALTIYNANFAVVRENIPLDLTAGVNHVTFSGATAHIEPDSVILRDPSGRRTLQVLEQNYRNDPISEGLLLSLNEGKVIDFQIGEHSTPDGKRVPDVVQGKIIRSGYTPHYSAMSQYGQQYSQRQIQYASNVGPIIEVDGRLQFTLPGKPLFPSLGYNTILKPTLDWALQTDKPGPSTAELSYITGGLSWYADYNVIAPPRGDTVDIVGWVTMDNQSGKEFNNARIKLMAGDVNKVQPGSFDRLEQMGAMMKAVDGAPVTEKAFDEYHLYTLERPATLHDRETKQVEFISATGVKSQRIYVYNGAAINPNQYGGYANYERIRNDQNYGTQSNSKVQVMQEFKNSKANGLGIPLPKGRIRFYRRDEDKQVEFTGENTLDHTPADETIRVYTGNAFDITGERRRTNYHISNGQNSVDEAFEIKVRNHKKEAVEVRVVERLYRWSNWDIQQKSDAYNKLDAQTVEFRVQVPPDGEKVVTYSVHYSW
ncbi:MAG TPA: DUF4139 domain-containing protein [Candidatus Angelobacter sp.]|nr:DUF4139 domain-containing protein [Candidatus Angelobacter sp.]